MLLIPIGVIHSPYREMDQTPFQGRMSPAESVVEVFQEYSDGLKDVEAASHLYILYWASQASRDVLQTVTPWGPEVRGVFACRSPSRPNPINLCVVELLRREGNRLTVRGLDALDGSPLLDIKPYSGRIDAVPEARIAWFGERGKKNPGEAANV
ncbi:MAG: tRNA (N6-threonylcarbamoyladenosine(37)-N6)-methyltransferase TrmO [Actinobacteria bacterium]|nr:tRNA (N6-threonylcarbamoyladenosine(37)-N6)-methyltransferase TrmO [Actinomycetota bacterium]